MSKTFKGQCIRCLEIKSLDQFAKDKRAKFGVRSICKSCHNAEANKRYHDRQAYIRELIAKAKEELI
ncbi:hypothetical protein [Peribacillus asahii]|uniref:hypothetical protein n=1 Tax=Peribacillus asahii TaxID=228899 RepID=UPI003822CE31